MEHLLSVVDVVLVVDVAKRGIQLHRYSLPWNTYYPLSMLCWWWMLLKGIFASVLSTMEHSLSVVDFVLVVEVAERDIGLHPHALAGNYLLAVSCRRAGGGCR